MTPSKLVDFPNNRANAATTGMGRQHRKEKGNGEGYKSRDANQHFEILGGFALAQWASKRNVPSKINVGQAYLWCCGERDICYDELLSTFVLPPWSLPARTAASRRSIKLVPRPASTDRCYSTLGTPKRGERLL